MSLSTDYLFARGITEPTIAALSFELDPAPSVESFNDRLHRKDGRRLVPHIREAIWFGCWKHPGEFGHYVLRPLPNLPDEGPKFLQPSDVPSILFIPHQTWAIKDKITRPLIFTEGPIKSGCVYQAGGHPVGIWGTWGVTVKTDDDTGLIELCPQLTEFKLFGRIIHFAFDADAISNPHVRQSIIRSFLALFKSGAVVTLLRWPLGEGKGLDDFLVGHCGLDVERQRKVLAELIDDAGEVAELLTPTDRRMVVAELQRAALNDTELDQVTRSFAKRLGVRASSLHNDAQGPKKKVGPVQVNADAQKLADAQEASALATAEAMTAYYDHPRKEYVVAVTAKHYHSRTETQFKRELRFRQLTTDFLLGRNWSQIDVALRYFQQQKFVDYVGGLAGRNCGFYEENGIRILVTKEPRILVPSQGGWVILNQFLANLLGGPDEPYGDEQLTVLYGWLCTAYRALSEHRFQPGQALAVAGPVDSGKSLLQSLITEILGGRSAKAMPYLQGRTDFNGELFEAEHLVLEDEAASTLHRDRIVLGASLKNLIANRIHPCHPKHRQIVNLAPWWRVSLSLNDRPERLLVLPPLSEDIGDKIMLLRASKYPMPIEAVTPEQKEIFWKTLVSELPAFIWWLLNEFELPSEWQEARFGVHTFHHPELARELEELSPALALLALIDAADIWTSYDSATGIRGLTDPWVGTALELRGLLMSNQKTQRDATRLLDWINACGQYLNDLAGKRPLRVKAFRSSTRRWFEIYREIAGEEKEEKNRK
jgi:hypothetical protein